MIAQFTLFHIISHCFTLFLIGIMCNEVARRPHQPAMEFYTKNDV